MDYCRAKYDDYESHKIFDRMRVLSMKKTGIDDFNDKLIELCKKNNCEIKDIDNTTKDILAEGSAIYARKIYAQEKNLKKQNEIKAAIEFAKANDPNYKPPVKRRAPTRKQGEGKPPDFTPGITETIIKKKYTVKSGEVKECEIKVKKERKGSKFHRKYTRAKEIYDYYKPKGIGTEPICSTNDAAKHFSMTNYMFNKIINAYELELIAKQTESHLLEQVKIPSPPRLIMPSISLMKERQETNQVKIPSPPRLIMPSIALMKKKQETNTASSVKIIDFDEINRHYTWTNCASSFSGSADFNEKTPIVIPDTYKLSEVLVI
jgi:hypothetical protein